MSHRKILAATLLALALALVAGCRYSPEPTLTMQDSGRSVGLYASDTLTVELESNPTTGYGWDIVEAPDEEVLKLLDSRYEHAAGAQELVGAGGTEVWRFKAVGRGFTSLKLGYLRTWEKGVAPVKTFSVQVEVRQ